MKSYLQSFAAVAVIAVSLYALSQEGRISEWAETGNMAATFGADTVRTKDLKEKYAEATTTIPQSRVRIFLMPGHEPDYGGAEYGSVKERDLNLALASYLRGFLEDDPRFEVVLGRGKDGWNPELAEYFVAKREEIQAWRNEQASMTERLVEEGELSFPKAGVSHQTVASDVALRLYGINKWLGESDFDFAIHIHINDYGSRKRNRPGELSGYAIYVPARQYSNSSASRYVAQALKDRFGELLSVSNAPREKEGIVEDRELVAVGRYNTAEVPSMLVEYGYIYEPQFQDPAVRDAVLREYAYQTYLGLKAFFSPDAEDNPRREVAILPYEWKKDLASAQTYRVDVLALQIALAWNGVYPPEGKTLYDCPISGLFGACTRSSVALFQKKYSIEGETGRVGERTRQVLNALFAE
ncbi:MAG: N-acetylmuramoyl-L-alanine amidase [Candidatus Taylorbacteria bacterium]|nr:N-acetylmuramoyl-L-alanine amidase [Candidatus Taylorbacteria bacterium]